MMSNASTNWAEPQRLAEWFGHGIDAGTLIRIAGFSRLASHCGRLINDRLGSLAASPVQQQMLLLDGLGLMGMAHQAGIIWHARTIVRVINGPAVRDLLATVGSGLRSFAIAHAGSAPDPVQSVCVDALPRSIGADGLACLVAWCDAQPASVGQRLILRLGAYAVPDNQHRTAGPAIIDTLLLCGAARA